MQRRCLSHEGSGNTRERQCLSHDGSGNTQGKGSVLATKAVETYMAKALSQSATAVGTKGKGTVLATKAVNTQGKAVFRTASPSCAAATAAAMLSQSVTASPLACTWRE